MDPQQQSRWRPTTKQLLWVGGIAALAFLLIVICGYLFGWKWTGLPKRTLWDWLALLIVPIVLTIGGYLFTRSENNRTQRSAEEQRKLDRELAEGRAESDREIADQRRQDDTLQVYLDQMGELLLEKNLRDSEDSSEVRTMARVRTLTVLPRLDGGRKGSVVQFLYESGLITGDRPVVDLEEANLTWVNLKWVNLSAAQLTGAKLQKAELRGANLCGARLREASLDSADLSQADLSDADLSEATFYMGTEVWGANLRGANMTDAKLLAFELEEQAKSLEGATMPNGQKYEVWKSTGRKE